MHQSGFGPRVGLTPDLAPGLVSVEDPRRTRPSLLGEASPDPVSLRVWVQLLRGSVELCIDVLRQSLAPVGRRDVEPTWRTLNVPPGTLQRSLRPPVRPGATSHPKTPQKRRPSLRTPFPDEGTGPFKTVGRLHLCTLSYRGRQISQQGTKRVRKHTEDIVPRWYTVRVFVGKVRHYVGGSTPLSPGPSGPGSHPPLDRNCVS